MNLRRTLKVEAAYNAIAAAATADDKQDARVQHDFLMQQKTTLTQQCGTLQIQLPTGVQGFTDTRQVQFCWGLRMALCAQTQLPCT